MSAREPVERVRTPLRLLLVEDSEDDALLIVHELSRAGYDIASRRVDTAEALSAALGDGWDLITCDWKMPGFEAPAALSRIARAGVDVPIIIVSGEVGEEFAVTAMKAGAHDFISKERLARLAPAVERELREAARRRAGRQAEEALKAAEHRFRALIENTADQVAVLALDGEYLYVSPSHERACGFTPGELLGTNAFDLVHPDDLPEILRRLAEGLRTHQASGVAEFRIRHKNGSWIFIEGVVQNLLDDPAIGGILVNGRDVTARRRMEETLLLQGLIIANLPEGVMLSRVSDDVIVHANPKFEAMFGYDPGELLGKRVSILNAPGEKSPAATADEMHRTSQTSGVRSGELRNRRKDGSEFWSAASISRFAHPDHGEVWVSIQTDVSERKRLAAALERSEESRRIAERKRAETALEEEREFYAALIRSLPDPVWMKDPAGLYLACNPAFERVIGRPAAEIVGRSDFELLPDPALADFSREKDREAVAKGGPSRNEEWVTFAADGRRALLETVKTPMFDGRGRFHGVLGISRDITQHRRVEEELRSSERRAQLLFQNMLNGYALCRMLFDGERPRDFVYLDVNQAFEKLTGLRGVVGRNVSEVIPGFAVDNRETLEAYGRVVSSGQPVTLETFVPGVDAWLEISAYAVDEDCFVAVFDNVTKSRRAEEERRRHAAEYRAITNASLDGFWRIDLQGRILEVNETYCRFTGYGREELLQMSVADVEVIESPEQVLRHSARLREQGTERFETRHRRKDGSVFDVEVNPLFFAEEPGQILVFLRDVTERKQAEVRLRESEERLRATMDAMLEGVQIVGNDWRYLYVNREAARQGRRRRDELLGRTVMEMYPGFENTTAYSAIRRCMERRVSQHLENEFTFPDGSKSWFDLSLHPLPEGVVIRSVDITQRHRIEAEVRQLNAELEERVERRTAELAAANRELEAFSYSVSHDLRAPLRGIDGFSRALLDDHAALLPAEGRHQLEAIRQSTERMGKLIEELLKLSHLGREPLHKQSVDTARLVREVLAELSPMREGRSVELRLGSLPPCEADPTLLKQIWVNLLANAFKYTVRRRPARIEIGGQRQAEGVVYFVRDNGAGFDMGRADKLFGVFQRLHRPSEFEGTGVGLAIVQRLVHRHGGRVWAEAAVERGATFYFTLGAESAPRRGRRTAPSTLGP
jgi:PAS domain S-box-containing protein